MKAGTRRHDFDEVIHSSESALRHPLALGRAMVRDLAAARLLAWRLFLRSLRSQYRRAAFGYFWILVPPLVTSGVWLALHGMAIVRFSTPRGDYPAQLLTGLMLWFGFADGLRMPLSAVRDSRVMLTKLSFPREALVLAGLGDVLFRFAVRWVVLLVALAFLHPLTAGSAALGSAAALSVPLFGVALGLCLVPLGGLYEDIGHALAPLTQVWLYLTPVVYPPPTSWPARLVVDANPISPLLVSARSLLLGGEPLMPSFFVMLSSMCVLLGIGWILYRVAMPYVVERMSV